jgi:hypothetical protein
MRGARRVAGVAMLACGLVVTTGAFGAGDSVKTTVKFSPGHPKPSKKKAAQVKLNYGMTISGPGGARPADLVTSELLLPPGMTADGAGFATCALSKIQANDVKSCPAKSIVGHAGGSINAQPIQDAPFISDGTIYATKAKAGKTPELAVFFTLREIPSAHSIGLIKFKKGKRMTLHFDMPELPTAPGLPNATVLTVSFSFDGKGSKGLMLRTTKACPAGMKVPDKLTFKDGSSASDVVKAC